jgi:hypothetical protein
MSNPHMLEDPSLDEEEIKIPENTQTLNLIS